MPNTMLVSELNSNICAKAQRQIDLLEGCVKRKEALSDVLHAAGLSYDDLCYCVGGKPKSISTEYYSLNAFAKKANSIPVVSFFSGAGGLDLGFEAAGFSHAMLVEKIPLFCETIKHNRPNWDVRSNDVSKTEEMISVLSTKIGSKKSFDGVFVGGPPCQPFSIAANQRFSKDGANFKRIGFAHKTNGNLLFEYIALIKHFKPVSFVIENVPGLMDVDGGKQLNKAYEELESAGYSMHQPMILKAQYYKVPQQRRRLFVIGNRLGKQFLAPNPTLAPLPVSGVFEKTLRGVKNHLTRAHSAESVLRYIRLGFGKRDKLGRVDRLDPFVPSKTVIAGGMSGGGRSHLHPYIPRTLSVRECARIQTFPDDYVFTGPVARQFTQVGNAVPPVLGAQIADAIFNSFYR